MHRRTPLDVKHDGLGLYGFRTWVRVQAALFHSSGKGKHTRCDGDRKIITRSRILLVPSVLSNSGCVYSAKYQGWLG